LPEVGEIPSTDHPPGTFHRRARERPIGGLRPIRRGRRRLRRCRHAAGDCRTTPNRAWAAVGCTTVTARA